MAKTKDRPVENDTEWRSPFLGLTAAEAAAAYASNLKRNVEHADRMFEEFGSRTRQELESSGIPTDHGLFAVRYRDAEAFPGYQFDENGRPLPVIAKVLAILRDVATPWEIAFWFTSANGWLRAARPVDLLRTAPERVIEAARHETEELVV